MTDTLSTSLRAEAATHVDLAGRRVARLGFGALHLAGPGGWGAPADRGAAIALVRGAVDAGIRYIDTADSLGPDVSEAVIAEALWPYPDDLVVATKAGMLRGGPQAVGGAGAPALPPAAGARLRAAAAAGGHPAVLPAPHRPGVPPRGSGRCAARPPRRGRHRAHRPQRRDASSSCAPRSEIAPIAAVQNHYNVVSRASQDVLEAAEADGIPFVTFWSLGHGRTLLDDPAVDGARRGDWASRRHAPARLDPPALARRPCRSPAPGGSRTCAATSRRSPSSSPPTLVARLDRWAADHGPVPAYPTR